MCGGNIAIRAILFNLYKRTECKIVAKGIGDAEDTGTVVI